LAELASFLVLVWLKCFFIRMLVPKQKNICTLTKMNQLQLCCEFSMSHHITSCRMSHLIRILPKQQATALAMGCPKIRILDGAIFGTALGTFWDHISNDSTTAAPESPVKSHVFM
jgi:hypothetical protein